MLDYLQTAVTTGFDYILVAFFAAFLGLKYVKTKATGHLWFLLPLVLVVGLNQGWGNLLGDGDAGKVFFVCYRLLTICSCFLAFYMYYRDYHKREAEAIAANAEKRKQQKQNSQQPAKKKKKKR